MMHGPLGDRQNFIQAVGRNALVTMLERILSICNNVIPVA